MNRKILYLKGRIVNFFLCAFFLLIILHGQDADNSINISHFVYPDIPGIPIILDESGENSFFLDKHYSRKLNDYHIDQVMIDMALHFPQGSYLLPALLPKGNAPDSINNYSQIHYRRGDYNSGELGIALQIEGKDSSYFTLQGFRASPPVIHSSSSWDDNLQNYYMSYDHLYDDGSMKVGFMYHLENFHLPLLLDLEYERKIESFHGGIGLKKKWENLWLEFYPAFQLTHSNTLQVSYLTLWNNFSSKINLWDHFNLNLLQQSKVIMAEKDNQLSEIKTHLLRPKFQYNLGEVTLEWGGVLYNRGLFEPEGKVTWRYKHLYISTEKQFHIYFEPVDIDEYEKKEYSLTSLNIGYIGKPLTVILDIFQVTDVNDMQPGFGGEIEIDLPWMRLYQKTGIYNLKNDNDGPLDMFNHLSLLFSPNIWFWRTARYQPFMGIESIYLQHSGQSGIDPTRVPIIDSDSDFESYNSNIINMEFGILVNRFKLSYRIEHSDLFENAVANSSITNPTQPIHQLVVLWQFWN